MIARQSVWTDPEVKKLTAKFIPAADEVGRLQSGKDAECRLFQKIAEEGHYAGRTRPSCSARGLMPPRPTAPSWPPGTKMTRDIVARKLREALKNWDKLKAEGRKFSGEDPLDIAQLDRADRFFPEGGLVLKVNTRDLPRDPPQQERGPTPGTRTSPGSPRMKPSGSWPARSGPAGRARYRGPSSSDSPGSISSTTCADRLRRFRRARSRTRH